MAEKFEIGEVAIIADPGSRHPEYLNHECTISQWHPEPYWCGKYYIDCNVVIAGENVERDCSTACLRKKRPPREDLKIVRWADCPWQPENLAKIRELAGG